MYKNLQEVSGKKTCSTAGCLKSKNGNIILEKDKILDRSAEYVNELFLDLRKDCNVMKGNFAGPPVMKDKIQVAIRRMKLGKALLEALEDYGIDKITLLYEIYDIGQIPSNISKSIFIALPKKPQAIECELHRTSVL